MKLLTPLIVLVLLLSACGGESGSSALSQNDPGASFVNSAPSFIVGKSYSTQADSGPQTVPAWATKMDDGDELAIQQLQFEIVGNSNTDLFEVQPSISYPSGNLRFHAKDTSTGSAQITVVLKDNGGTSKGGENTSTPAVFSIHIIPPDFVNKPPTFTGGGDHSATATDGPQVVTGWAKDIDDGDFEVEQALWFEITNNSNPGLFDVQPTISYPSGTLRYNAKNTIVDQAEITVVLKDDGGVANGGDDTSTPVIFAIDVTRPLPNKPPVFTAGEDVTVSSDIGDVALPAWATDIHDGDIGRQSLQFITESNSNPELFTNQPWVSYPSGTLRFTPDESKSGTANIGIRLKDSGGTYFGGSDVSAVTEFEITVGMSDKVSNVFSKDFSDVKESEKITLNSGREVQAAKDEVLFYLKEDITQTEYDEVISYITDSGATVLAFSDDLGILQIRIAATDSELSFMADAEVFSGVNSAGLNDVIILDNSNNNELGYASYISNSQSVSSLWSSDGRNEFTVKASIPSFVGDYWIDHIDLETAWAVEDAVPLLSTVTIGVVDTGIPSDQKVLEESRLTRYNSFGENVSDDDTFGSSGKLDNHGLWTTAFSAGFFDESKTTGLDDIARGVSRNSKVIHVDVYERECSSILNCTFGGATFTTNLYMGIFTAIDKGADVINISWGDGSKCEDTQAQRLESRQRKRNEWSSIVKFAKREDRLLLFSSGNNCEKQDNQLLPLPELNDEDPWLTHAVIVGATDSTKTDALFSRMGDVVNLMAPGQDVGYGEDDLDLGWWDDNDTTNGTSFSTPMATGVAAIIKGINGTLSAPEIRHILIDTAEPTVNFADAATEGYKGYSGSNATHPNIMLNAGNAAKTAELTRGVELESLNTISLTKGSVRDVPISIKLPETTISSLDVVFLIDVSGSYGDDIESLQRNSTGIINNLNTSGLDVQFGVASFSDFPISNYGDELHGDEAYFLNQRITSDVEVVTSAINNLNNPLHHGRDLAESQLEALYQLATGVGRDINGDSDFADKGELQPNSIGWRTGALRVVFFATDAPFHNSDSEISYPGAGKKETISALQNAGITVIGLQSGSESDALSDISSIVNATNGSIHSLSSNSSEIAQAVIDGLNIALASVDITIEKISGSEWINNITPLSYNNVLPGSERQFIVSLSGQRSSSIKVLNYTVWLWIRGDGSALLKRVKIPISVPIESTGS